MSTHDGAVLFIYNKIIVSTASVVNCFTTWYLSIYIHREEIETRVPFGGIQIENRVPGRFLIENRVPPSNVIEMGVLF